MVRYYFMVVLCLHFSIALLCQLFVWGWAISSSGTVFITIALLILALAISTIYSVAGYVHRLSKGR